MAQVAKKYSLFQRSVRVVQTSMRSLNWWLMDRMPGLPNPPDQAEELRKPTFVDLWEFTFNDHRQRFRDAWREYKDSFTDPADIDIEKSKEEVRKAAMRLRGHVEENAGKNAAYIEERLEGTQVLANIKEIGSTASSNVSFLKGEFGKAQAQVDPEAVVENVRAVVDEHRSKKDVVSTLSSNVDELVDLVKTGRDAALKLEAKDVEAIKGDAQSWFADKLMVAQSVLLAFIEGYREGKAMEIEREDALLLSYAKQAAQEQSVVLKQQFEQLIAAQKEKQAQERRELDQDNSSRIDPETPSDEGDLANRHADSASSAPAPSVGPRIAAPADSVIDRLYWRGTSNPMKQRAPQRESPHQLAAQRRPSHDELVRLDKVDFSDDEDDDTFQYAAIDDDALGLGGDDLLGGDDEDEEDLEAVLRNLNRSTAVRDSSDGTQSGDKIDGGLTSSASLPSITKYQAGGVVAPASPTWAGNSSPTGASLPRIHTQVRPAVVDDFIRNFLIKVGMTRTLDMFNHEWYEFISKGKLKEDDVSVVPDIYMRNQFLDDQVKELRKQLDETRQITEKAKGTWDKFRKQRDVHKMHHQRVLQEKEALVVKIKKMEKHVAAYEPLLQELKAKYENSMKEKMLMRLERDRQVAKAEALEAQLKALNPNASNNRKPSKRDSEGPSHGPLPTASSSSASSKGGGSAVPSKKKAASSESPGSRASASSTNHGDTKLPSQDGANPYLDKRYEPVSGERLEMAKTCPGHANSIASIAFHPRNPILATVSDDQTWRLWSIPQCELVMSGEGHRSWLSGIEFHPRGTHVATSSGDNTVKLWDFVSASCSLTLSDHSHPVWESVFHHEGDFLVSASMDHTCKLWDLHTGKCRKTLRGHVDSVNSVCFQPFTTNICTGSGDKTISIWDMRSGLCVQTFYGHQNACNSVSFALQGDTIVSSDADGFVKIWDVRMVAERSTLDGGQHPLNSVAFDRSGKTIAAASDDGTIKVFSLKTDKQIAELKGHDGPVQSVKFEPTGRFLGSSSSDCTFRLWST